MEPSVQPPGERASDVGAENFEPTRQAAMGPIEIGVIVAGRLDSVDRRAVEQAREQLVHELSDAFPQYQWRLVMVDRIEAVASARVEPVSLALVGVDERDAQRWDFALVVTAADLITHYRSRAFAVVSRVFDLAVVSTARLDPRARDVRVSTEERTRIIALRLRGVILHTLGHLVGLSHHRDATNPMYDFETLDELDALGGFDDEQRREASEHLADIADVRLEEEPGTARRSPRPLFYLRAAWINRAEILEGLWQAAPWQLPVRLGRLTATAVPSLFVLMITAETWELAAQQSMFALLALLVGSLAATTSYVAVRQRLLLHRPQRGPSEQIVVTNTSSILIVLSGLLTTAAGLFAASLGAAVAFFRGTVAASWTTLDDPSLVDHVEVAVFVTSLSLLIGALGASFEEHHHFRHMAFVDEEV